MSHSATLARSIVAITLAVIKSHARAREREETPHESEARERDIRVRVGVKSYYTGYRALQNG